jgi:hypothetical protein
MRAIFMLVAAGLLLHADPAAAWNPLKSKNGKVKSGNKKYSKEAYAEALESYDKAALQLPEEGGVHFDRGDALFKMAAGNKEAEELELAAKAYADALGQASEEQAGLKASSLYNLGNVRFAQERWQEAIAAYRQSLKTVPGNKDAAYNLALALKKLEEQEKKEQEKKEQEKKEQEKKDQEQCDSGQEQQQEQQGQQQQEQQGQQEQQQQGQQEQQQQGQQEQQQPQQEQAVPVTEQEAEAILDALQRQEKNLTLDELRNMQGGYGKPKVDKDW